MDIDDRDVDRVMQELERTEPIVGRHDLWLAAVFLVVLAVFWLAGMALGFGCVGPSATGDLVPCSAMVA